MKMRIIVSLIFLLVVCISAQAQTDTPTPTFTPTPTATATATLTPTPIPTFAPVPNGGVHIPQFLTDFWQWLVDVGNLFRATWDFLIRWLQNFVAAWADAWGGNYDRIGQVFGVIGDAAKLIFQFTKPVIEFFTFIINNLNEVIELAKTAIGILVTLAQIILGWLGQIATVILGIFSGILDAPPVQMPGLPRCITAPMESQICALWYMGEYTIFADATPGEYLVPLATLAIDIIIIAYTIKSVIRIGRLFEAITNVG